MPRKKHHARVVKLGEGKRGRHRQDQPREFVRWCDDCGFYEMSRDPNFIRVRRECPNCSTSLIA